MKRGVRMLPVEMLALLGAALVAALVPFAMSLYITVGGGLMCPKANAHGTYQGRAATVCLPPLPIASAPRPSARPTDNRATQSAASARAELWRE